MNIGVRHELVCLLLEEDGLAMEMQNVQLLFACRVGGSVANGIFFLSVSVPEEELGEAKSIRPHFPLILASDRTFVSSKFE